MQVVELGVLLDRLLFLNVFANGGDLLIAVTQLAQSQGIVLLTILKVPPPTSFFTLTSEKSGSIPVVSQSIMKAMVPVGARRVTWAFR